MIGDLTDIMGRLRAVLPVAWFPDPGVTETTPETTIETYTGLQLTDYNSQPIIASAGGTTITASNSPVLDGLLAGVASVWTFAYSLLQFVVQQARMATASGVFVDMIAWDFFGSWLTRRPTETDASLLSRIKKELFRQKATRAAMICALTDLTGNVPTIFEPAYPLDTGSRWPGTGVTYGGSLWTDVRPSIATYLDGTGALITAPINTARPYFVGSVLSGVINEAAATNIAYPSVGWVPNVNNVSDLAVLNAGIAPDGSDTATMLIAGAYFNDGHLEYSIFGGAINTTYTFSVFLKANGYTGAVITLGNTGFANTAQVAVDLVAGTIVNQINTIFGTITPAENGWYRVSVTNTSAATVGNYVSDIRMFTNGAAAQVQAALTGNGISGLLAWGQQIEIGYSVTSYIPTTTATATRASDSLTSTPISAGGLAYNTIGGYGSLLLPFQYFITAYRPSNGAAANVAGYGSSLFAGMPGGYGVGSIEYINISTVNANVSDQGIFDVINDVKPAATLAWVRLNGGIVPNSSSGAVWDGFNWDDGSLWQ